MTRKLHDKEDRELLRNKIEDAWADHATGKEVFQALNGLTSEDNVPHFVMEARPSQVPAELAKLPEDAEITWEDRIGGGCRGGRGRAAGQLRDEIERTIVRQRSGLFTVNEAAQELADAGLGSDARSWRAQLRAAHRAGVLPIRDSGSRIPFFPCRPGQNAHIPSTWTASQDAERDTQDLVREDDLDDWLRTTAGYEFPRANVSAVTDSRASPVRASGKRWTAEAKAELAAYKASHGTKKTASHYGISEALVRRLCPTEKPAPKGYSAFNRIPK